MRTFVLCFTLGLSVLLLAPARAADSDTAPTYIDKALGRLIQESIQELSLAEKDVKERQLSLNTATDEGRTSAQLALLGAKEKRDASLQKLLVLESARSPSAVTTSTPIPGWTLFILLAVIVLGLSILAAVIYYYQTHHEPATQDQEATARVRLANVVTFGSLIFIVTVSVLSLLITGMKAAFSSNVDDSELFSETTRWILGSVLPVVGAWVGGVMAYYFGKENMRVGIENAKELARELSPNQKLEARKAGEFGLELGGTTALLRLNPAQKLDTVPLEDLKKAYSTPTKTYERLPILDDKNQPMACLHLSTLNQYLATLGAQTDIKNKTLSDLAGALKWKPELSFATAKPDHNLSYVQTLIKDHKECSDVFVTENGTPKSSAIRWITNDDIVKLATT